MTDNGDDGILFEADFGKLEVGQYTVIEKNTAIEGYELLDDSVTDGAKELKPGEEAEIDLLGIYRKKAETGDLIFTQTVTGGVTQEEAENALKFTFRNTTTGEYLKVEEDGTISLTDVETEVTLKELIEKGICTVSTDEDGYQFKVVLKDVKPGEYEIDETYNTIEGYRIKDTSVTTGKNEVVTGGESRIDHAVEYEKIVTGKLIFTKAIYGAPREDAEDSLTFTIQNDTTGKYLKVEEDGTISWVEEETVLTLGILAKLDEMTVTEDGENGYRYELILDDLETGSYIITEKNSTIKGYKLTNSVTDGNDELKAGGEAEIDLMGEYVKDTTGTLVFIKTVTGGVNQEEAEGALTFIVRNETTGKYLNIAEDGSISWVDDETQLNLATLAKLDGYTVTGDAESGFEFRVVLEGIEAGTYSITEMNAAVEGFKTKTTSVTAGSAELTAGEEMTITLRDDYEKETVGPTEAPTDAPTKAPTGAPTSRPSAVITTRPASTTTTTTYRSTTPVVTVVPRAVNSATGTTTGTTSGTTTQSTNVKAAKTGDDTNALPYMLEALTSILILLGLALTSSKKRSGNR